MENCAACECAAATGVKWRSRRLWRVPDEAGLWFRTAARSVAPSYVALMGPSPPCLAFFFFPFSLWDVVLPADATTLFDNNAVAPSPFQTNCLGG